jgi:hypothetical protein
MKQGHTYRHCGGKMSQLHLVAQTQMPQLHLVARTQMPQLHLDARTQMLQLPKMKFYRRDIENQ